LQRDQFVETIDEMELRQLEIVVALSEELHFGRTAERVHLSQPALTQALSRFESQLGARLFERTSRRVTLTPAGAALVPRARALLEQAADAADLVGRVARGEQGTVRLGVVGSAMLNLLPELVRSVRAQHPGVELDIREEIGAAQVEELRQRRLDLGIMHVAAGAPPEGLRVLQLRAEPLSIALPADHRLAQRAVLRLSELRDEPLVLVRPEQEADTSALYLGACADAGFAARVGPQVTSLQAQLGLVAAGLGWAFVSRSVIESLDRSEVAFVALRGTAAQLPIALAWPARGLTAPARVVRATAERLAQGSFEARPAAIRR
jgi:DNA-binding transcriptional LysR family regulator